MTHRFGDAVRADESSTSSEARLAGTVVGPEDPGGTTPARICFNALVDRRPGVIAQCLAQADIATAR
jgi:hypothetical protein